MGLPARLMCDEYRIVLPGRDPYCIQLYIDSTTEPVDVELEWSLLLL